jgi:putative transposase
MARRLRLHLPSTVYHVMLRGNDGQSIFFSDEDKSRMCLLMQEGVERFDHHIYSFCFMTNHIHLAIQVGQISISRIIQNLAFRYTRYINKKYKRIGHP